MKAALTFGGWLKRRRGGLGLTQKELAQQVGYAEVTLRKVEADELRPSREMAEKLTEALQIMPEERAQFIRFARDEPGWEDVALPTQELPAVLPSPPTNIPHNLPTSPTRLIGRKAEIATATALLCRDDVWLVTLSGPGGSGKTRLALEIAFALVPDFADGVFYVDLAPLQNPALVLPTIAHTLGLQEAPGQTIKERLQDYLQEKQILLLLDNFEQVSGAAPHLTELHRYAPKLTLLVTSRTRLRLRGEKELLVSPLPLPERRETAEDVAQAEAVQLFVERVQDVQPDFALTESNAATVAAICTHLDGLPLAIELAAARCNLLRPQALLAGLAEPLRLLTRGPRDLPDRQQTLRATITWSYNLLADDEQTLFRRLAVFAGGFTLEAVNAVCATNEGTVEPASFATIDRLETLVDNNLVQQKEVKGELRFRLLETIREYALEQLAAGGEQQRVEEQSAHFFVRWAEAAEPHLKGAQQAEWFDRLELEHDNLRAALEWTLQNGAEAGLQIANALWWFWYVRGYYREGRGWLERVLTRCHDAPAAVQAGALNGLGSLARRLGDNEVARSRFEASIVLRTEVRNDTSIANALANLATMLKDDGEYEAACALYEESLAMSRALGDKRASAYPLQGLGMVAQGQGDYPLALAYYQEAIAAAREAGDTEIMATLLHKMADTQFSYENRGVPKSSNER